MSTVLKWLAALLLTVPLALLGWVLARDPGRLSLHVWGWQIDTTLVLALLLLVLLALLLLGLHFVLWRLPLWLLARRRRHLAEQFRSGLLELAYARPLRAKRKLLAASALPEYASLALLAAAYSAEQLGEQNEAEQLWQRARQDAEVSQIAAIHQAKFKLARNDASGLAELTALAQAQPGPLALRSLVEALKTRGRAAEALSWFPKLLTNKAGEREALAGDWSELTLLSLAQASTPEQLSEIWLQIGKAEKLLPSVVTAYAAAAQRLGQAELAERVLQTELERAPSEQLYAAYARLPSSTSNGLRIKLAERWLAARGETPALLFALGRLCSFESLWGKAQSYLERSLAMGAGAEAWEQLAELAHAHGELAAACTAYRNALASTRGTPTQALALNLARAGSMPEPAAEARGVFGFPLT